MYIFWTAILTCLSLTCSHGSVFSIAGDSIPCGNFKYYNGTWDAQNVPNIIAASFFELDSYIDYLYTTSGIPSVSFGVVYGNELIHYHSVGTTNTDNSSSLPNKDTIYRIGSVSKVFTTLLTFILRDKGFIHFDSPVCEYNSNFSITNPWGIDEQDKKGKYITIKHLASQISGLPREVPCINNNTNVNDAICQNVTSDEILQRLSDEFMLLHPTDTQPSYSNLAYSILGNVLSEYIDMTYEEAVMNLLIKPLNLSHTGLYLNSEQSKYAATGYDSGNKVDTWVDLGWSSPAGQIFSSVQDLQKLMSQFFAAIPSKYSYNMDKNNNKNNNNFDDFNFITQATSLREMLRPVFINSDLNTGYGSPFELQSMYINGNSKWIFSKDGNVPGFSTDIAMLPTMRLGVIALSNDEFDESEFTFTALNILSKPFESWLKGKESGYIPIYPNNSGDDLSKYEGDYYLYEVEYVFTIKIATINDIDWLIVYSYDNVIYGQLLWYNSPSNVNNATFIYVDLQHNSQSCWVITGSSFDGSFAKFIYDNKAGNVYGVQFNDNNYGITYVRKSSSVKPQVSLAARNKFKYSLRKSKRKMHNNMIGQFTVGA